MSKNDFIHGIAYICAELVRSHDLPTIAADIIYEAGYTYADLKKAKVDSYDLKPLRKELLARERSG